MIVTLATKISNVQWIAIVIQVSPILLANFFISDTRETQICGLAVTQYHPKTGSTYPFSTYLILIFQVFLSASSGVYNQALLKSGDGSLHAANMTLYAAGATINFMLHLIIRVIKPDEPGFFTGYGSWGALLVILSNVFIGLAITAVYKCKTSRRQAGPKMLMCANFQQMRMLLLNALLQQYPLGFCFASLQFCLTQI
jgi:hypothetical protein